MIDPEHSVMHEPTLTDKVSAEDWVQDRFHSVHLLNHKSFTKPNGQLKSGGEIRVLIEKNTAQISNCDYDG